MDVFVGSYLTDQVTEIRASNGALVRVINNSLLGGGIGGLASDGDRLFVSVQSSSVAEFSAASGALITDVSGEQYAFDDPQAIVLNDSRAWVVDVGDKSLTEFPAP